MKEEIVKKYIEFLSNGKTEKIIDLFSKNGKVHSPIYGVNSAKDFFRSLGNDTMNSELELKEIFQNSESGNIALYFEYAWTLKSGKTVVFDVVDIFKFNPENKISELKIIYDTRESSRLVKELKN